MKLDILAPNTMENYMILHRLHPDTLHGYPKNVAAKQTGNIAYFDQLLFIFVTVLSMNLFQTKFIQCSEKMVILDTNEN